MTAAEYALAACLEYEHWASEVDRLSMAITMEECPHEAVGGESDGYYSESSCFGDAKERTVQDPLGDYRERRTLDDIAECVKGCESCTQLVALIRERYHVRKWYGVAKRKVRFAGKRAEREVPA